MNSSFNLQWSVCHFYRKGHHHFALTHLYYIENGNSQRPTNESSVPGHPEQNSESLPKPMNHNTRPPSPVNPNSLTFSLLYQASLSSTPRFSIAPVGPMGSSPVATPAPPQLSAWKVALLVQGRLLCGGESPDPPKMGPHCSTLSKGVCGGQGSMG